MSSSSSSLILTVQQDLAILSKHKFFFPPEAADWYALHWVQIKLQPCIFFAKTHHSWQAATSKNILPYICHIYLPHIFATIQVNCCNQPEREYIAILPLVSFLKLQNPLLPSFLSFAAKAAALRQPPHALPFAVYLKNFPSLSNLPLFHIIFTDSLYVSLYIIFTMKK